MSTDQTRPPRTTADAERGRDLRFLTNLAGISARWRTTIFWVTFLATVVSVVVAFVIPPQFKSTASVFPAEKTDILGSLGGGIPSLMRSMSPATSLFRTDIELDKYTAILKSGRVLGEVIRKFDLVKVYDITTYPMENTTKELLGNVSVVAEPEGYLTVTVFDEDPQRAADMANFFVAMLDRTNQEIQAQNARATRIFIEDRYKKNLADLAAAEDSLRAFQLTYGVIAMPEQTEATVKAGVTLAADLAAREVELGVLQRTLSPDHPSILAKRVEIEEFRKKIAQLNLDDGSGRNQMKMLVPYRKIPDLGVEYVRRYREVQIQSKILEFLTPIFEQAKVEEKKESPSVIVLDAAGPAERKAKPKRALIILGGMVLGLLGSYGYALASTRWSEMREQNADFYRSATALGASVKGDLRRLRERLVRSRRRPS